MIATRHLSVLLLGLPLLLGACSDVRDTLGLTRNGPDEFGVATAPPLVMPPDFTLRPPAPGTAGAVQTVSASDQARATLLGTDAATTNTPAASGAEAALLQQAGTKTASTTSTIAAAAPTSAAAKQTATLETVLFGKPAATAGTPPAITMKRDSDGWFSWL